MKIPARIDNFLPLTTRCGWKLKTTLFPAVGEPHTTLVFWHEWGSYQVKSHRMIELYQRAGYEVIGFDCRGFGESEGVPGYMPSRQDWISDSVQFCRLAREWQLEQRGHSLPWVAYGYSMGGCYLLGTYMNISPSVRDLFKAILLCVPQCGMGKYFWPRNPYLHYRQGYLRSQLGFPVESGSWPPLLVREDATDSLIYKGRTVPATIWMIQDQTI